MVVRYELDDLAFGAATLDALQAEVVAFLKEKGLDFPVATDQACVKATLPDDDIDTSEDERIICGFCTDHRFGKARKVAKELLKRSPWVSEGYRLLAQIEMEEGAFDAAIPIAQDALRLNPRNVDALILLGNLFARDKGDLEAGAKYFERAYKLAPDSVVVLVNYAALRMRQNADAAEQERLFRRALELDATYLNAYYALCGILVERHDFRGAFDMALAGLRKGALRPENSPELPRLLRDVMLKCAVKVADEESDDLIERSRQELADFGGVDVKIEEDASMGGQAKMELAQNHKRDFHRLVYNRKECGEGYRAIILHELEKQKIRVESEKGGCHYNFAAVHAGFALFREKCLQYIGPKLRAQIPASEMDDFLRSLQEGLGGQLMNTPLDHLADRRVYAKYPESRPSFALAVMELIRGSVDSARTGVQAGLPRNVVRLNRILSLVSFLLYRELFGFDFIDALEAPSDELKTAEELYRLCSDYSTADMPADTSWMLIRKFLSTLRCEPYYAVVGDGPKDLVEMTHDQESRTFRESLKSDDGMKSEITRHMVTAIRELRARPAEEVKAVAIEVATLGMGGINPNRPDGYSVPSLGSRDMSGPQMLAYYYVSWKLALPEKVDQLGLPFAAEYERALDIADSDIGGV